MQRHAGQRPGRGRALASLITVASLGLAATSVVTTATGAPAQADGPVGDCTPAYRVADLTDGEAVHGLTVNTGTDPEPFTGEVLGVLGDGIAPGLDMVMVRLTSSEIDRVGIWQGMSGSPVYVDTPTGQELLGAVAYGLASGPSPVAGLTPFEDMDGYLAPVPVRKVAVGPAAARTIARETGVSAADAEQGFVPLPAPLGVAGVGAGRLASLTRSAAHPYLPKRAYAVGRASADAAGPGTIVAGGNLVGSLSYGDITMAMIGTTTWTCGEQVIGFGHPLGYYGRTTLGMHPADAIYVQEDLFSAFKVANVGPVAGTITEDRMTGTTGVLGELPATARVHAKVRWGERSRAGTSHVTVRTPDAMASTTFYEFMANQDRVVDGSVDGSEVAGWTVSGTDPRGVPFTLTSRNRYVSEWSLGEEVGFTLGDVVYALAGIPGVTIDAVSTSGVVHSGSPEYQVTRLQRRVDGRWVEVGQRRPVPVVAGTTLRLRVTLSSSTADDLVVPVRIALPARLAGRGAYLSVLGGQETGGLGPMNSLPQARRAVAHLVRNDQVQVTLVATGGARGRGDGGGSGSATVSDQRLGPYDGVVRGQRSAELAVR